MPLTKADKFLIGIMLVISLGGIVFNMASIATTNQQKALVYKDGELIQTIALKADNHEELRIGGQEKYNLVTAENGRIRITEADCPDQTCVRTGWVSMAPQQIVCLPYRVVIKVVSNDPIAVDDIAR